MMGHSSSKGACLSGLLSQHCHLVVPLFSTEQGKMAESEASLSSPAFPRSVEDMLEVQVLGPPF